MSLSSVRLKTLKILKSIWFFPSLLTLFLILATVLQISGSSIDVYDSFLGTPQVGHIAHGPQGIRSDEWLVATQMEIEQNSNHYKEINKNIGYGQNMSFVEDAPIKDWSTIFHPENWSFLVLPFTFAFAFKWWFMAYALLLSSYFFVLALLPGKKVLAALISLSLIFSPFIQWWYQFDTLAPIYYGFIAATIFIYLLKYTAKKTRIILGCSLAYVLTCFLLILYPPFMIDTGVALGIFCIGYLFDYKKTHSWKEVRQIFLYVIGALAFAGLVGILFIETRLNAYHVLSNTVYPGKRTAPGGGYDVSKIFGGFLSQPLQIPSRAILYGLNQSEDSNFILLSPFLFLPSIYLMVKQYRKTKEFEWSLIGISLALIILFTRILTPALDPVLKFLLLNIIPARRLIVGIGVADLVQVILFIKYYNKSKAKLPHIAVIVYCLGVFAIEALIVHVTKQHYPGYIGYTRGLVFGLCIAVIIYLILRKKYIIGFSIFVLFSIFSSYKVMPLYRNTTGNALTSLAISKSISSVASHSKGRWITEGLVYENLVADNGAPSLSGVFDYPQLNIWKNVAPKDPTIYNRYAHINYFVNRQAVPVQTHIALLQPDNFGVYTDACSSFLKSNGVKFILAESPIDNSCISLLRQVPYPNLTFYIYRINY
jgi:hypothetical protein